MDASQMLSTAKAVLVCIWVATARASPARIMVSPTPVMLHATPGLHHKECQLDFLSPATPVQPRWQHSPKMEESHQREMEVVCDKCFAYAVHSQGFAALNLSCIMLSPTSATLHATPGLHHKGVCL